MRRSLATAALIVLGLGACRPATGPTVPAPRYALSTVMADLAGPRGLAVGPEGLHLTTQQGYGVLGPEGELRMLAEVGPRLKAPAGLAIATGSALIADPAAHRVWLVIENADPEPFAGTGTSLFPIGDGGLALSAQLNSPSDVVLKDQALYIADSGNHRIRKVDANGRITTVAGDGMPRLTGDGGPATAASLHTPTGLALGSDGTLYVADSGNHAIRVISPAGQIATLAGTGTAGFGGDGGPARQAQLSGPEGLVVLPGGDLLVADTGNRRIRWFRPGGPIQTVAGTGQQGRTDEAAATSAALDRPSALALAPDGSPFVTDRAAGRVYQLRQEKAEATASASPR